MSVSGRVHVVLADEGWILEQCGRELERRLPYVHVGSAADQSAAINYYVNYAAWRARASAIEVALFTHIEERVPEAAARFFAVAHAMTTCICMSRVYAERLRAAGMVRPEAVTTLVARFQSGDTSLANRVLSLIALHVWWEDYLGEGRIY